MQPEQNQPNQPFSPSPEPVMPPTPPQPPVNPVTAPPQPTSMPPTPNSGGIVTPMQQSAGQPQVGPTIQPQAGMPTFQPIAPAVPKRGWKKLLVPVAAGIVLLGGGSAAAYFGYVVPNKPANRLVSALTDLAGQREMTVSGVVDYADKKGGNGVSVGYKVEANTDKNQMAIAGTVGVSGTQYTYDVRYLDKNIYAKVGGLEKLGSLISGLGGSQTELGAYGSIIEEVDDQWYVVDRSFWQAMGSETSCVTDISMVLSDSDIDMIKAAYEKHPLFSILNTADETIDGQKVLKLELDPASDAVASSFAGELKELSIVKNVRDCLDKVGLEDTLDEEIDVPTDQSDEAEDYSIIVYLTGDNKLKKLEIKSEDDAAAMKMDFNFAYSSVEVSAPEGAKPLQDLAGGFLSMLAIPSLQQNQEDLEELNRQSRECSEAYEYMVNNNGQGTIPEGC